MWQKASCLLVGHRDAPRLQVLSSMRKINWHKTKWQESMEGIFKTLGRIASGAY